MFIRKLQLTNYKNHQKKVFLFEESMHAFVGLNGVGKTNILDSIYTLCIGKSYFNTSDKNCVKQGENFYRLEMNLIDTAARQVVITFEQGKKKRILVDEIPYAKNSNHVGHFPAVMVSPNDNQLITGNSEERRKFIDVTLAQISPTYLQQLVKYNSVLKQRNALLKQAEYRGLDKNLLAIYNESLSQSGQFIFDMRKTFFLDIQAYFEQSFKFLAAKNEGYKMHYKSDLLQGDFNEQLQQSLQKDLILRRTNKGIHKDDIVFLKEDDTLKDFGSQGQQKTFLLALKLTQFNFLKAQLNKVPLFIIDDIFDKLDSKRSQNLVRFLVEQKGQVFISNTDNLIFQNLMDLTVQIFEVE
jgi:DNA replication and repair protein RecF